MQATSFLDYLPLLPPLMLLPAIVVCERISGLKICNFTAIVIRRSIAIPFLVLSMNWMAFFTLTDYRAHNRVVILPLSLLFLYVAFVLIHWRVYNNAEQASRSNS
jgi:hypothetical protein